MLDEVQHKLKLTQLLLAVVVQVPKNGKGLSVVDYSSLAALEIIEGCFYLIGHAVKIANLREKLKPALKAQVLDVGVRLNEVAWLINDNRWLAHFKGFQVIFKGNSERVVIFLRNRNQLLANEGKIQLQLAL